MRIESTPSEHQRALLFVAFVKATCTPLTHTGRDPAHAGSPKQQRRAYAKALRRAVREACTPP